MKEKKTIATIMEPMGRINLWGLMRLVGFMGLILPMLLMLSCSSEEGEEEKNGTLAIVPFSSSYYNAIPWDTRAPNLPTNYEPYGLSTYAIAPKHTNIGVWLTQSPANSSTLEDFVYKDDSDWRSSAKITANYTYNIYGYMPHTPGDNASIAPLSGNYANGAVITLTNHNTLTEDDLSVIVGVRKGSSSETIETLQDPPLRLGTFQYTASANDNNNILFVLLKHIYAGLRFSARIDPEYHKVREIYVTKVDLTAHHIYQTGTVEVTLTANASGTDPSAIKYTPNTDAGWATINLYEYDRVNNPADKGYCLKETEPTSFIGCFAPGGLISDASGSSPYIESYNFTLKTTYDVYDKKGNLIRQGCTAENKIDIGRLFLIYNENAIQPGYLFTINLRVEPTYIYLLSDQDLDNPTIEIE